MTLFQGKKYMRHAHETCRTDSIGLIHLKYEVV